MHTNYCNIYCLETGGGGGMLHRIQCNLKNNKTKKEKKERKALLNVCFTDDYTNFRVRFERTSVHFIIELLNLN